MAADWMTSLPWYASLLFVSSLIVGQLVYVVYQLFFSPLANVPGPKLAAATHWCEFYYDVVQRGQFAFKIKEWHAQYGRLFSPSTVSAPVWSFLTQPQGQSSA